MSASLNLSFHWFCIGNAVCKMEAILFRSEWNISHIHFTWLSRPRTWYWMPLNPYNVPRDDEHAIMYLLHIQQDHATASEYRMAVHKCLKELFNRSFDIDTLMLVTHINVIRFDHHCSRERLVAFTTPSHYLIQRWRVVNWTPWDLSSWECNNST